MDVATYEIIVNSELSTRWEYFVKWRDITIPLEFLIRQECEKLHSILNLYSSIYNSLMMT